MLQKARLQKNWCGLSLSGFSFFFLVCRKEKREEKQAPSHLSPFFFLVPLRLPGEEEARFSSLPLARCHGRWTLYAVAVQGAERRGASVSEKIENVAVLLWIDRWWPFSTNECSTLSDKDRKNRSRRLSSSLSLLGIREGVVSRARR